VFACAVPRQSAAEATESEEDDEEEEMPVKESKEPVKEKEPTARESKEAKKKKKPVTDIMELVDNDEDEDEDEDDDEDIPLSKSVGKILYQSFVPSFSGLMLLVGLQGGRAACSFTAIMGFLTDCQPGDKVLAHTVHCPLSE